MAPFPKNRITLKHIAEKAGVSRMTVSLALRNDASLPENTRLRIQAIAEELGYQPDPDIARLMEVVRAKKIRTELSKIAYLTTYHNRSDWQQQSTQQLYYEGARQRAREYGYELEEYWLRTPGLTARRLSEIIYNRGIEGALVAPLPTPEPIFDGFYWDYISAVELGYSLPQPALNRACNHQFQSMMLLARTLYKLGYRRIGLAMARDQDDRVNHNWRAAYVAAQSLWAKPPHQIPFLLSNRWSKSIFRRWLNTNRPECIISIGKDVARWLHEMGFETPRDVGLANVDLSPDMKALTGIDQNSRMVGVAALDLLISQIRHNERGIPTVPRVVMVEGTFVKGTSTCEFSRRSIRSE